MVAIAKDFIFAGFEKDRKKIQSSKDSVQFEEKWLVSNDSVERML
jgi:hypothetical protein